MVLRTTQQLRSRLRRAHPLGVFVVAFIVLTLSLTWPLVLRAGSTVQDLGDPLYEIWTMRWTQRQILQDIGKLWHGNTAYPFELSLLFSEPRLSTSLLAWPVQLLTGNDVLTYNLLFLGTFVLLGVSMALLVREITGNAGAGFLAGLLAAFTPYRYGHISHLNLLGYGWIPLTLWALLRFARRRRARDAILAGVSLTIQLLASDTVAVMALGMVTLAVPFLLWRERERLSRGLIVGLGFALAVPIALYAPVVAARLKINRTYGFTRDLELIREMAAEPINYVSVSPVNHFWGAYLPHTYPNPLFPGAIALVGLLLGLMLALRGPRYRVWGLYALLLTVAGFVLSLGPDTVINGRTITLPYRWLYDYVPGMSGLRDVARFGMVAILGVQLLAGLGFDALWQLLQPRLDPQRALRIGSLALVLLTGIAVVEFRSEVGTEPVPRDPETVAVYDWLATQPRGAVFELPANGLWTDVLQTTQQIYYSTRHWQPIIAGYTSFLPDRYVGFLLDFHGSTNAWSRVDADNVGLLQDIGVRYVVVHHRSSPDYDWREAIRLADQLPELEHVGTFGAATVYHLDPGARQPVRFKLTLPEQGVPGGELPIVLTGTNENENLAVSTLDRLPDVVATWYDETGETILTSTLPLDLPVALPSGDWHRLLPIPIPSQEGNYRLEVAVGDLVGIDEQRVAVRSTPELADGPAVALSTVEWSDAALQPGATLDLTLHWRAERRITRDYMVTLQLIDDDHRVLAQADGPPIDGQLMTSQWQAGMTIAQPLSLRLPPTLPESRVRLLVALYDPATPTDRLPIRLPDGEIRPEGVFGPVRVAPR